MGLNFTNNKKADFIPLSKNDAFHNTAFKLIATGHPFLALALHSEGFVSKTMAGPEKAGNPTIGIGNNLIALTDNERIEGLTVAGLSRKAINSINASLKQGKIPEVNINLQQALKFSEWTREKFAAPAAEKYFGKEFMENLPPMRKAAIEYIFYHYGENSAAKMTKLMNNLKEENFANLGEHATSNRRINYKDKEVLFPNSRTGLILDLALKDMGNGEFFFFTAIGPNGERVKDIDNMASKYDQLAKHTIAELYKQGKLKRSGNNIIKITAHTEDYIENLNEDIFVKYLASAQGKDAINSLKNKGDLIPEEEILNILYEEFKKEANKKGVNVSEMNTANNIFTDFNFANILKQTNISNEINEEYALFSNKVNQSSDNKEVKDKNIEAHISKDQQLTV